MRRERYRLQQEDEDDPLRRSYELHAAACERRRQLHGGHDPGDGFTDEMLRQLGLERSVPGSNNGSVIDLGSRHECIAPFEEVLRRNRLGEQPEPARPACAYATLPASVTGPRARAAVRHFRTFGNFRTMTEVCCVCRPCSCRSASKQVQPAWL